MALLKMMHMMVPGSIRIKTVIFTRETLSTGNRKAKEFSNGKTEMFIKES